MDLDTENRIAAILMKEAAELRRQADKEGVHVYLSQPKIRGRPNSRFLTATVLGVQQANRAVEVDEMWRARQKELELNDRLNRRSKDESNNCRTNRDTDNSSRGTSMRRPLIDDTAGSSYSSSKRVIEICTSREYEGLGEEDIEEFLHSRVKRGRGAVGPRMDETGPFLPRSPDSLGKLSTTPDVREHRIVFGPAKPSSLKSSASSDEDEQEERPRKLKKVRSGDSIKKLSGKHKSKDKSKDKKKKRKEEKRRKQH
ncbi:hypothetical protein CFOL_v3_18851 [Cephalotus follicularis]|uniref:Uncharacterized protein n=1 Tax=Cephalotus follicularis TaxID=3775 RepID=A0A1Q3C5N4_CEPFO|nr:hypothetical protein CFOL_v3_18851 [Cephalotus follicularis]